MTLWVTALALGVAVGLVLALTGAGGGVLSVPLLVFGLHLSVQQAAPVGLLAVGIASALGAYLGLRQGMVRYRAAFLVGVTGMLFAPLGVTLAQHLPNRPLLVVFACVLAYIAWRTLKPVAPDSGHSEAVPCKVNPLDHRLSWTWPCARALAGTGAVSGLMSGLLGVGGGFVIIPALVKYTDIELRSIQLTSLAIIALVSVSSVGTAALQGSLPWHIVQPFTLGTVLALLVGQQVAKKLEAKSLQRAFAWLCVAVALLMLARAAGLGLA